MPVTRMIRRCRGRDARRPVGDAIELLRQVAGLLYVATALVAFRWYLRERAEASKWLAATFATLATVVVVGIVSGDTRPTWLWVLTVAGLLAYPYLLMRFAATFDPFPRWVWPVVSTIAAGLLVWTAAVMPLAEDGASRPSAAAAYVLAVIVYFVALSVTVAWRLWHGGHGQPTLARRRMRSMAAAALLLSLALVAAGTGGEGEAVGLTVQLFSISATLLFLTAFATPGVLRASWRAVEEDELYRAAVRLMTVTTATEVAGVLLPHVRRVVGARVARLTTHDGAVLGLHGQPQGRPSFTIALSGADLEVWMSRYTPFFGVEEQRLGARLGLLADLALARADLLGREQQAREDVEAANRELEAFVYTASHDLKTPLLALLGFVDLLDAEPGVRSADAEFYLTRMRANARYMQDLIADLLELSRVGRVDITPEEVDLADLVRTVASHATEQHPGTAVVVDGELPHLWANATRLRQLVTNAVENAARYGGRPDITVSISAEPTHDGVELGIRDDGVGIPSEHRERVFGVFERLDQSGGGTGIGLALCRKIAEELGGSIRFADSDTGADLRVELPLTAIVAAPPLTATDRTTTSTTEPEIRA